MQFMSLEILDQNAKLHGDDMFHTVEDYRRFSEMPNTEPIEPGHSQDFGQTHRHGYISHHGLCAE